MGSPASVCVICQKNRPTYTGDGIPECDECARRTPQLTPAVQHTRGLTLYALADDLVSLLDLREDMAENKEGTQAVDAAIAEYMAALPQKVDGVAHVIRTLDSQTELAAAEVQRLAARRRRIASAAERLRQYCCDVLAKLPAPNKGSRKLEGSTATLVLKGNGGLQRLDVYEESLIPDEYCTATITMPWAQWTELLSCDAPGLADGAKALRSVDNEAVRKALAENCWACEGEGKQDEPNLPCPVCGGSGRSGVPGARLLERGHHLEIR